MTTAERRKVGPVVGISPFRRCGEVRPGEIVLDGSSKLGEDPRVFETRSGQWLDRRRKPDPAVLAIPSFDLRFHAVFFARKSHRLNDNH